MNMPKTTPGSQPDGNSIAEKLYNSLGWEQFRRMIEVITPEISPEAQKKIFWETVEEMDLFGPDFSLSELRSEIEANGGEHAVVTQMAEKAAEVLAPAVVSFVQSFLESNTYKKLKRKAKETEQLAESHGMETDLAFFVLRELETAAEYSADDLPKVLEAGIDSTGSTLDSPYSQIIDRAKAAQANYIEAKNVFSRLEKVGLPRVNARHTDELGYPMDKPNSIIWNLLSDAATTTPDGQINLKIDTGRRGSKQDAIILYSINFDELPTNVKITKQLTPFDKRAYIAAAAILNAGNDIMSTTQIYSMMGNRGKPKSGDIQKINDSLTKMGAARIYIDNTQEVQQAKGYKLFQYDAPLLPFERISSYINGKLTEDAIHLFREPPLISFARQRNQITTINRKLLESPINKTDANLLLDDYLLERIGHMKNGSGRSPRKMLFTTIYDRCQIKTPKQKQRAPEKIHTILDHYKSCEWIKGYTEEADGITILL